MLLFWSMYYIKEFEFSVKFGEYDVLYVYRDISYKFCIYILFCYNFFILNGEVNFC